MIRGTVRTDLILRVADSNSGNWHETNFPYLTKGEQGMFLRDAEGALDIIERVIRKDALEEAIEVVAENKHVDTYAKWRISTALRALIT